MDTPTVDALLAQARAQGLDRLDAQVLLAHTLGHDRTWLRAHGDATVDAASAVRWAEVMARRLQGTPVAYLTGQREFYGLDLHITPDVLDPRPDTETLVEWALDCLRGHLSDRRPARVADLGCGSGAIALALARHAPAARVIGVDASAAALEVARRNGNRLGLAVDWRAGHWLEPLGGQTLDLIVSNPPYIAADDPHLQQLHAEPVQALVAGDDGLSDLREIVEQAPHHLSPGGWLLLEHGFDQGDTVAAWLTAAGWRCVTHRRDLAGHVRCTGAQHRTA